MLVVNIWNIPKPIIPFKMYTVLFPALIRDLAGNCVLKHYLHMLKFGLDPDEKNLAGFSCNDTLEYFRNKPLKGKRYGR